VANPERPDDKTGLAFPDDDDARADAIDERIERLRRLHGWASDTKVVSASEVEAVVEAVDGAFALPKGPQPSLSLQFNHPSTGEQVVAIEGDHYDVGSGEKAKLRVFDASIAARHIRIYRDGDGYRVRDMNTRTGTWVNEERVPLSAAINDGDKLRLGDVNFTVILKAPGEVVEASTPEKAPAPAPVVAPVPEVDDDDGPEHIIAMPLGPEGSVSRPSLADRVAGIQGRAPRSNAPAPQAAEAPAAVAPAPEPDPSGGKAAPGARKGAARQVNTCFLVYFDSNGDEQEAEVTRDKPLVVGRKSTANLRLVDHGISGVHAAFEWVDGQVVVRDLGSTNGTWVHGERVPRATLVDEDVVRLGLVPLRVCVFGQTPAVVPAPAAPAPVVAPQSAAPIPRPAEIQPKHELGRPPWHVLFLDDRNVLDIFTLSDDEPCAVAGSDPVEIQLKSRDLLGEHVQVDWLDGKLSIVKANHEADLKVNDVMVAEADGANGDVVTASGLVMRVVRGASRDKAPAVHPSDAAATAKWTGLFRQASPELEFLFVDPEAAGGRVELSIWGDGVAQVDLRAGDRHERVGTAVTAGFLRVLLDTFELAGFPDSPAGVVSDGAAGPEFCAFHADTRAAITIDDALASASEPWRAARDLLRAIVDYVVG